MTHLSRRCLRGQQRIANGYSKLILFFILVLFINVVAIEANEAIPVRDIYKRQRVQHHHHQQQQRVLKGSKKKKSSKKKSKKDKKKDGDSNYDDAYYNDDNYQDYPTTVPQPNDCMSSTAQKIRETIPNVITRNPPYCCLPEGSPTIPTAVYITHSQSSNTTPSGFEPFWDIVYDQFLIRASTPTKRTCFVMTGYNLPPGSSNVMVRSNQQPPSSDLGNAIKNTIRLVSTFADVPVIMTTDPTKDVSVAQEVRVIVDNQQSGPSVGIFNAGYTNIKVEALISQKDPIPFVGYIDDREYGTQAANSAKQLLGSVPAVPLCFNARPNFQFVNERCSAFYASSTIVNIDPTIGIPCTSETTSAEIYTILMNATTVNSIFAHVDCCDAVAEAAYQRKAMLGPSPIIVGCQDYYLNSEPTNNRTGPVIDYVITQPIDLQVYHTSAWSRFPLLLQMANQPYSSKNEVFPAPKSIIETDIYTEVLTSR